jgi:hypothetical protein
LRNDDHRPACTTIRIEAAGRHDAKTANILVAQCSPKGSVDVTSHFINQLGVLGGLRFHHVVPSKSAHPPVHRIRQFLDL